MEIEEKRKESAREAPVASGPKPKITQKPQLKPPQVRAFTTTAELLGHMRRVLRLGQEKG